MDGVKIVSVRDEDIFRAGQLPVRGVAAAIMVGDMGPFTVKIQKSDTWDTDLRMAIEAEAQRVRSLQA